MTIGVAGTVESNDCLITVEESDELEIIIESIVMEFFGEQIKKVIVDTLVELKIKTIKVTCNDKGALDYTIKSRLVTAIKRMEG